MADITPTIVIDDFSDLASTKSFPALGMKLDNLITHTEQMPSWLGATTLAETTRFLTENREGVISGTVKVQGVLQNKARVNLYYRKSGQLIQSTFTDANGVFSFACGLDRNVSDYYAVAITESPFNAQVFDKLTPA